MTITHRLAQPSDIERLSAMLDAEFIFGKGRNTSIAQRYPSTLSAANSGNIFLAEDNAEIVSVFLCKRFAWHQKSRVWQGAMIGSVYSAPDRRGEGIASALMKWGIQVLKDAGVEFAVLWTTQAEFYARMGWAVADNGVLGSSHSDRLVDDRPNSVKAMPVAICNDEEINAIRIRCLDEWVERQTLDYFQQPIPSERVDVLLWQGEEEPSGYALSGHAGDTGILYEMLGSEDGYGDVWRYMQRRYKKIIVNDSINSRSYHWLSTHTDIVWERKKLAMWLSLSSELHIETISNWTIPYFDRI